MRTSGTLCFLFLAIAGVATQPRTGVPRINPGPQPLKLFYSQALGDYAAVSTPQSEALLRSENYTFVRIEGLVRGWLSSETTALNLFRCPTPLGNRYQTMSSLSVSTMIDWPFHCAFIREEGQVFTTPAPDRVELVSFWKPSLYDAALGGTLAAEEIFLAQGYTPGSNSEGHIIRSEATTGWRQQKAYWRAIYEDNMTGANPSMAGFARGITYDFVRAEGWVSEGPRTGMIPLYAYRKTHYRANGSLRTDNFLGATPQAASDAQSGQYVTVGVDGFCYAATQPGTVPLKRYWNAGWGDYFTLATAASEAAALNANFQFLGIECYVPLSRPLETSFRLWLRNLWYQYFRGAR